MDTESLEQSREKLGMRTRLYQSTLASPSMLASPSTGSPMAAAATRLASSLTNLSASLAGKIR